MTEPLAGVRKLSHYIPLGQAPCEACGNTVFYNMAAGVLQHKDPAVECDRPWPKVERTPEEEARIRIAEAVAIGDDRVLRERHAWLLANAPHPILRALVEAHGPVGDHLSPTCAGCPPVPTEVYEEPEDWPCGVWSFVSDRMEKP